MRRRFVFFLVALIILSAIIYALTEQPQPAPVQIETAPDFTTYLPIVTAPGIKLGYSWAWFGERGKVSTEGILWYYRAWPFPQDRNPYPLELIPMVHCADQLEVWRRNYPADYNGWVLWLNEPLDQCIMTPEEAYYFYIQFRADCPDCRIVGPNNSNRPGSMAWFAEFMEYGPDIQAIGIHYYIFDYQPPGFTRWETLEQQLRFYSQYGVEVWVTEFGTDNPARVPEMLALMEQYGVKRAAYFAPYIPVGAEWPPSSRLFGDDGGLTAVGRAVLGD